MYAILARATYKMTIFDESHIDELREYTRNLLALVKQHANVDISKIFESANTCFNDRCEAKVKRNRIITRCKNLCKNGSKYCDEHNMERESKRSLKELEFIMIDNKEYLYDSNSKKIYTFKNRSFVGQYDELTQTIVCI